MASDMIVQQFVESASDLMTIAALGRPFTIGMLYDARSDELIPGLTLWDAKTVQENTIKSSQPYSKFNISASDTIESKSSLLNVEASLKASFLSGLIEVGGSAKYLNDQKKYKNQSRVTCQYKTTTMFKQLAVNDLKTAKTQQIDVIKKGLATHVVTGILYGADAFFVFDSEKLEASKVQNVQGHMEAVIKKIPSLNIEGSVDLKMTDEEKALTNKFSCKFYGDFILDSNPATFKDAVQTYVKLPTLLGENKEKVVPMKVWLMPLRNFDPEAAELMNEISIGLVRKMQTALEDLKEMEMRCNDCLEEKVAEKLPQIRKELSSLKKLCGYHVTNIKQDMAKKLPSIREGKEDESSLKQLFEDRDQSPFSHDKLSKWLDSKERQVNVIRSCLDIMEGTKIVTSRSQLDKEVLSPGVEDALCFVFTSLDTADPCLDEMENYLETSNSGCVLKDPWHYSNEVLIKMREKAQEFHGFAKAQQNNSRFCFLIAAVENEKYTGATIYHYKNGILVTEDYSKPELPPVETITDRKAMMAYACDLNLDPNTANSYLILSEGNKKATVGEWQSYPDRRERFDHPQVLCKEALSGRHYWEVEWSDGFPESVYLSVVYGDYQRKGKGPDSEFGKNTRSWAFGKYLGTFVRVLNAYHNGNVWEIGFPSGCNKVGLYLDWPAGTLSLYRVSSNTLTHMYTFHTKFTEPVYPGIWADNKKNYAYLLPF